MITARTRVPRITWRSTWRRLRGGELTLHRATLSVALGLAIGVTPLWGIHLPLVLAICLPLRLDAALAYLAANISIPPFAPFISLAEIEIGAKILTGHAFPLSIAGIRAHGVGAFVKELALGTFILSALIAGAGGTLGFLVIGFMRAFATRKTDAPFSDLIRRTALRYKHRADRIYVQSKLRVDPITLRLLTWGKEEDLAHVFDLGSGCGQLPLLLLEAGCATEVTALDWDEAKIQKATLAAGNLPAKFTWGDARSCAVPPCDTALLVDVLHYFTPIEQLQIVNRIAHVAKRRIFIRDFDPDRGWRSWMTRAGERLTTGVRFHRGTGVHEVPLEAIYHALESKGFRLDLEPCWGKTPFSNVLIVAQRYEHV